MCLYQQTHFQASLLHAPLQSHCQPRAPPREKFRDHDRMEGTGGLLVHSRAEQK